MAETRHVGGSNVREKCGLERSYGKDLFGPSASRWIRNDPR